MPKEELTLVLGGDTAIIRRFSQKAKANPKYVSFLKVLEEADVVFTNFECTLTNYEYPAVFHSARADPALAEDVASIGIDVVSVAHRVLDFGVLGLLDTFKAFDRVGIKHVGAGRSLKEAMKEEIIEVKGQKIGVLGFSVVFPSGFEAGFADNAENLLVDKPGVAPIYLRTTYEISPRVRFGFSPSISEGIITRTFVEEKSLQNVLEKIKGMTKNVDSIIVSVHWGEREKIIDYQPPLAHAMIDAGADIVFGHHPHRPHGVEVYKGRPIFYCLGNFLYHRTGLAPYLGPEHIIGRVKMAGGNITKIEVIPTWLDDVCTSIADVKLRDKSLEYLKTFEEKNKFGTKYTVHGKEIPIEVSI